MKPILAISVATMIAGLAGHAAAQSGEARSVSVSFADLDLSRASGREALEQRISNAVLRVCAPRPAPIDLTQTHEYDACRSLAMSGARQQLAQVYDGRALAQASITVGPGKR